MRHGDPTQQAQVREAIRQGHTEHFDAILAAIDSTGALDYTRRRAREEVDAGRAALRCFPEGEHRDALLELAEHAVGRDR